MSNKPTKQRKMDALLAEVIFVPDPIQRRCKAAFWAAMEDAPLVDKENISIESVRQITGYKNVDKWWSQPGFLQWFKNEEEFKHRMEYLANLALDTAEELLSDREASAAARANMVKIVLEAASKMPQKYQKEKVLDGDVAKMDAEQLTAYLKKHGIDINFTPQKIEGGNN